jgi:hypothetical protein
MPLFEPERHVRVQHAAWDPELVERWLRRWAADALATAGPRGWPVHPRDASDFPEPPGPLSSLYFGACGVWLALIRLAGAGLCELPRGPVEIFDGVLADHDRAPDIGERVPSWFLGESSLLTARCLAGRDAALEERLAAAIRGNRENPTREALWGAPGTMVAALCMLEATGEERWAELYRDSADAIWSSWFLDERRGVWLWEQDMYGSRTRYVGAGHGWAGNLYPLWRGRALLSDERQAELRARTLAGLERLALVEGDAANWPPLAGDAGKLLVQWCHGAPGVITSLRHAELPEALPLLIKGAELVVRAGPLIKGVGFCHGTDGNGAALLEMYRRTQDRGWLARAREFAMAAVVQSEAEKNEYGQWRYSLWTGDAGLACFLGDCLRGSSGGLPGLDGLW